MESLIPLESAVNLCISFLYMTTLFDDYSESEIIEFKEMVRSEMEQKALLWDSSQPLMFRAADILEHINTAEIAAAIKEDRLSSWCRTITDNIQILLNDMNKSSVSQERLSDHVISLTIN